MADFGHIQSNKLSAKNTAEFTFHDIQVNGKSPTLILAPATEANKPYFNALLKSQGKKARQVRAGNINTGMIEQNRDEDRDLYPKYIVQGWFDVVGADGKEVEFNIEDCIKFLKALDDFRFDDVRNFAGNPHSFAETIDVQVTAGNSKKDSNSS